MSFLVEPLDQVLTEAKRLKVEIATQHADMLFRAVEALFVGDILPCLSSPVRMELLRSLLDKGASSQGELRTRFPEISDSAMTQHLDILGSLLLIKHDRKSVEPTTLAKAICAKLVPVSDCLTAFHERQTSLHRFDLLSRLLMAWTDGVRSLSLSTLAKHCGLSDSAMFKHLKQLQEVGLIEETEKWGSPYAISDKGRRFTSLLMESVGTLGVLIMEAAIGMGTPRKIVFPTATRDKYHLISFDGRRLALETVPTLQGAFEVVPPERLFSDILPTQRGVDVRMRPLTLDFARRYRALYERLEGSKEKKFASALSLIEKELRQGKLVDHDFDHIVLDWKRLGEVRTGASKGTFTDVKGLFADLPRVRDEQRRIELFKTRGIEPSVGSAILAFKWPDEYPILESHAWNALSSLGYDLPKKKADEFTSGEFIKYLSIVRDLAKDIGTSPRELDQALYAYDKVSTDERWRQQLSSIR
jgi:predicted transcriptional regulator